MLGLLDLECALSARDLADIADLSAHGGIERCLICDDRCAHAVCDCFRDLIGLPAVFVKRRERDDLAVLGQLVIAVEFGIAGCVHLIVDSRLLAAHGSLDPASFGFLAGFRSGLLKALDIHGKAVLHKDVLCGVDRESVCIVEKESVVAA